MLKDQRKRNILNILKTNKIIKVSELTKKLDVTEMTIRRDLKELELSGQLIRIHGGAKIIDTLSDREFSHLEKRKKNYSEKMSIASKIVNMIKIDDIVFLGGGTTIELVGELIGNKKCKIITNSYFLFDKLAKNDAQEVILIAGSYRKNTGVFVGSLVNNNLRQIHVKKCFISSNGISRNSIYTSNEPEGECQKIIMDNSKERYLAIDNSKIGMEDFYDFYSLHKLDAVIVDNNISKDKKSLIKKYTNII